MRCAEGIGTDVRSSGYAVLHPCVKRARLFAYSIFFLQHWLEDVIESFHIGIAFFFFAASIFFIY